MTSQQVNRLAELLRGIETAMFTTVNIDGSLNSRPMVVQDFDFDGDLWFFTQKSTSKVDAIHEDSHVGLVFMEPKSDRYISASGTAEVIEDLVTMKRLWRNAYAKWFPDGPGEDDLVLIRVQVSRAQYWDAPNSEMVENFYFSRAHYKTIPNRERSARTDSH